GDLTGRSPDRRDGAGVDEQGVRALATNPPPNPTTDAMPGRPASRPPILAGSLLLTAVVAGLAALLRPGRADATVIGPAWARAALARLEREGRRRGRPRRPDDTVIGYADELAATVLPDPRVRDLGVAVSAALFRPSDDDDAYDAAGDEAERW